jgi:hypothetical protein
MLTPAAFHELAVWAVRHGLTAAATAAVLSAAFDADFRERQDVIAASGIFLAKPGEGATGATSCNVAPSVAPKPATSKERSDKRRTELAKLGLPAKFAGSLKALKAAQRCNVAPVAPPPLSLINIDSKKEREGCNVAPVAPSPGFARSMPLPDDFQPNAKTWAVLTERVGEVSGAVLVANFCDYYGSRPHDLRTAAEWQTTLRKWARSERKSRDGPAQLRLMRKVASGPGPARPAIVYVKFASPQWDAWQRFGGSFPRDRDGGWWFATEWPPGYDASASAQQQRRESG